MAETVRFRCNNCGHRFDAQVLSQQEKREAERELRPLRDVACPNCNRADIRRGWE